MAKGGKLTKLKSVLKKMQSFKLGRPNGTSAASVAAASCSCGDEVETNNYNHNSFSDAGGGGGVGGGDSSLLRPVYVGKSRRRYLVGPDVVGHPLVRELVDRSGDGSGDGPITVGCEVVLFEHLLWMLENADPQPECLDELVEFYAC
ncbi:unnamed protein product [Cuscuta campestris]|uniref:Auxin-responsive protein SAUR72 n=1 Tax=Cuscuta campestris TaxID=132261 RepID=A0A484KYZ0_9ASTE|nr:unnamed protein product [Cuscuta campestris]